jgi:hypothetical protein
LVALGACTQGGPATIWASIPRPAPDDPAPQGIAYLCEGRREVAVVYAKNRASVTFGEKTWRTEYQPTGDGFRYADASRRMDGPRRSRRAAEDRHRAAAGLQLPAVASHDLSRNPVAS